MRQHILTGIGIALALIGILLGLLLIYNLRALLLLALIALVITVGIDPVVRRLQRFSIHGRHLPRGLAAILILLAALVVFAGIITFFTAFAVNQAMHFANNAWPELQVRMLHWMQDLQGRYPNVIPAPSTLLNRLSEQSGNIAGYVWTTTLAVFGVIGGLFSLVTIFILTLFFTLFKDGIAHTLLQFVPPQYHDRVREVGHEAAERMGGWLRGQVTLALIVMIAATAGMFFGLPQYAAMIGIIAGIGELIPLAGPYVAAIPALIIVLATGANPLLIVWVLVFFTVLSQVENYVLAPKVMERHVKLSPVTTVCALLAGGALLGLVGAVLAIPVAAAGRVILFAAIFPAIQRRSRREIELSAADALPSEQSEPEPEPTLPEESASEPSAREEPVSESPAQEEPSPPTAKPKRRRKKAKAVASG